MKKKIIIDAHFPTETRVVLLDKNNNIENIEFSSSNKKQIKSNIYLAKITRVEPSLQAAFVDYGEEKSGFLPFSEIHSDYYHLPSKQNTTTFVGDEINAPEITSDDLAEKQKNHDFHKLVENDEIDIATIEKMVNDKTQSNINIEAEEDEVDTFSKPSDNSTKHYKIQEVIKKGQILLVQATKEERGNKGAALTTHISLAGKYCVLMPNKPSQNGISRKISNGDERRRLKKIINDLAANEGNKKSSVIARTASAGHTTLEIKRDYDYLAKLWNKIREATLKSKAPCFIHQEDGIVLKTIRDMFDNSVKEIFVQGAGAYNDCIKFVNDLLPGQSKSVKEYRSKTPIFTKFGIEDQLIKLYQPIVHLPSGGYIVINPTEALISIDVNSGKATSERNIEEMALKTNLEAAKEVARQARLRDLSGLLVIDFIDLAESKNRKIVERSLWEYFSKDKARIQTSTISTFGLLEMSRQRLRPSFLEMNSNMCNHCSGKGVVRADNSNAMLILRTIENEIHNGKFTEINVYGMSSSIVHLLNEKRSEISFIEQKYSIKLNFFIDKEATSDSYSIEKIRASDKNRNNEPQNKGPALQDTSEIYKQAASSPTQTNNRNKRKIEKPKQQKPQIVEEADKDRKNDSKPELEKDAPQQKKEAPIEAKDADNASANSKEQEKAKPTSTKKRIPKKPATRRAPKKTAAEKSDKPSDEKSSPKNDKQD